jgi:hypothetical protein
LGEWAIARFFEGDLPGDIPVLPCVPRFIGLTLFLLVFGELSFSFSTPAVAPCPFKSSPIVTSFELNLLFEKSNPTKLFSSFVNSRTVLHLQKHHYFTSWLEVILA